MERWPAMTCGVVVCWALFGKGDAEPEFCGGSI
jgi:hypothetical protein